MEMDLRTDLLQQIEQQAVHAMQTAAETIESLHKLARLFIQYFDHVEEAGWDHFMLKAAKNKTYMQLPRHDGSLWSYLKATARDAFQKAPLQMGSLPLQ